jgi:ABC-type branched-subunit amino acid transport system ATPase component
MSWSARLSQVMEGRHCFGHLTIEENLLTGAYTRSISRAELKQSLEKVYHYFPRLKERRGSQAGYTSGGEQQMCAIGRALMAKPSMILLDEPSMGIAPQIVDEIFGIVKDSEQQGERLLPAGRTKHQHRAALRRLRLHPGKRPRGDGRRGGRTGQQRRRQGVLPRRFRRRPQELPRHEILPAPQALAGISRKTA